MASTHLFEYNFYEISDSQGDVQRELFHYTCCDSHGGLVYSSIRSHFIIIWKLSCACSLFKFERVYNYYVQAALVVTQLRLKYAECLGVSDVAGWHCRKHVYWWKDDEEGGGLFSSCCCLFVWFYEKLKAWFTFQPTPWLNLEIFNLINFLCILFF